MKINTSFFFVLFLWSCATIVAPSGGPKDVEPPIVEGSEPQNYALNFSSNEVMLSFDEYVAVQDLRNNLLISPPLKELPKSLVKGKSLLLSFQDTLVENTTYTFNFGNSIKDITEGNILKDFQYVVSTGNYIDSLKVLGSVKHAFKRDPIEGATVMLYACDSYEQCDSLPYLELPRYFGTTNLNGEFAIQHIKSGKYFVFALNDANQNYLYDLPNEEIGFSEVLVDSEDTLDLSVSLFKEMDEQRLIKSWSPYKGKICLSFKTPVDNLKVTNLTGAQKKSWEILEYSANRDTVCYWNSFTTDTLNLIVETEVGFKDTAKVVQDQPREKEAELYFDLNKASLLSGNDSIVLVSKNPIVKHDFSTITLLKKLDSAQFDTVPLSISFNDPALRNIYLKSKFDYGSEYTLIIKPQLFVDVFGNKTDTLKKKFLTKPLEYFGNTKLNIIFPFRKDDCIVQLINAQANVIREVVILQKEKMREGMKVIDFTTLSPGAYRLRLIYDRNRNGKWDTGQFLENVQPERMDYYPEDIIVRSNWDIDLEWTLEP